MVHVSSQIYVFVFFRKLPRSAIAKSYSSSTFKFWRGFRLFPRWVNQFIFTSTLHSGSLVATSSLPFVVFLIIAFLTGVKWCLIVGFDLHFPDEWCWTYYHVSFGHLYTFFRKMSIRILCPFFCGGGGGGSFPDSSVGRESACNAGDPGWIPGQEDPLVKG